MIKFIALLGDEVKAIALVLTRLSFSQARVDLWKVAKVTPAEEIALAAPCV